MIGTDVGPWPNRLSTTALASLLLACGGDASGPSPSPTGPKPPAAAIATISITPSGVALFTGTSVGVEAKAVDASGRPVQVSFSWATSNATVARVNPGESGSAQVDGIGAGEAMISAAAGGKTASVPVLVDPSLTTGNDRASNPAGQLEEEPQLAITGGGLLLGVWQVLDQLCCVLFASSADGGKSWSPEVPMRPHKEINPLTDPLGRTLAQKDPWLTVDERGVLYFGWLETISHVQGMQEVLDTSLVLVARSGDEGATWSTAVNVQRVQPGRADKPSIASDAAGTLYVGYTLVSPNQSVVVTRSLDGGETWSTPVELATGNVLISNLAAGPAGQVCAGWFDLASRSVRVGCSSDQGSTWLTTAVGEAKSDDVGRIFSPGPHVAASRGGTFAVAWIDPEFNLRVIRSEDAGATWSQATAVNDESQGRRWQPTVAIGSDDRLHASWYDDRTGLIHVVYSSSVDGGQTWSPNLRVTSEPTPFGRNRDSGTGFRFTAPDDTRLGDYMGLAAAEDGSVHVLWTDWRSSFQAIFHAHIP